jgi:YVTN family beta-propeller protein
LAAVLIGAAPLPAVYTAPAGQRVAGAPNPSNPYDVILPNGRIVAPIGRSVAVGMNALGVALSPDGRYAIVSNDDEQQAGVASRLVPGVRGGYSLAVVDTSTMSVTDVYAPDGARFFLGIVALKDPADPTQTLVIASGGGADDVRFLHLDAYGKLHDAAAPLQIPPAGGSFANADRAFPGWIALAPGGRTAYVVNNVANTVAAIDVAGRRLTGTAPVGFEPYAAAVADNRLIVTDPGLMKYSTLPAPVRLPEFSNVAFTPGQSSALSWVNLSGGAFSQSPAGSTPMDQAPDGVNVVGGGYPGAIAISKNKRYAYVCMTNVDRIAVVDLLGTPHVVGGLQLRLFDRAPYGTQPNAIALGPDGKRLYVALAGMNAVAVLDATVPSRLHRLGLIATGWYPSAIAVSPTGRFLYVANAKGLGQEPGFEGGPPYITSATGHIYKNTVDGKAQWATLQRIDLHKLPLGKTTLSALRYNRIAVRATDNPLIPPLRSGARSSAISHVVFIIEENKTYDAMLGDLTDAAGRPWGKGDPSLVSFGAGVTPNLHALADQYALATNYYADSEESDAGHQFATAGTATSYVEKTLLVKAGRAPLDAKNEDPEDYPRDGYIFNALARAGITYRDYGDLLRLSGYDKGEALEPRADDPYFRGMSDESAATSGVGGLYTLDTPALAALNGHVDLNYPGWNLRIRDMRRAQEFIRDYTQLARQNAVPAFTYIWLPDDHGGAGPDIPPLPEEVADGDRALGTIVDFLSHRPEWSSTAIFITPDDAQSSRDHVNEHRSYAIVVSPFAKRHFTSDVHVSTVSILKTEEELLGLQPLSLGELLAADFSAFFQASADPTPFSAVPVPTQTASAEGSRIAALLGETDQSGPDADVERSARIVELSRQADALAARRSTMSPQVYGERQQMLYESALHALRTNTKE